MEAGTMAIWRNAGMGRQAGLRNQCLVRVSSSLTFSTMIEVWNPQ